MQLTAKPLLEGLFVGTLAVILLINGVRMSTAGIADFQTRAFLADWEAKGSEPSARAWKVAVDAATRAVEYFPVGNGVYLERLGYVHTWQHFRQPFDLPSARAGRITARDAFRQAVQARPTWPFAWEGLARSKLYLLEFDAEFHHAFNQASLLGPWRPAINQRIAEIGFIAWPQLDAAQRANTLESAQRGIQQNAPGAEALFTLAHNAGQRLALCQGLDDRARKRHARHCGD